MHYEMERLKKVVDIANRHNPDLGRALLLDAAESVLRAEEKTKWCVVIEHLDGSVSANGPYVHRAEAALAAYAMAEYEAKQLETTYEHDLNGSVVGNDETGEDTMTFHVQPLGVPVDTDNPTFE
jgi:hypothetical protein